MRLTLLTGLAFCRPCWRPRPSLCAFANIAMSTQNMKSSCMDTLAQDSTSVVDWRKTPLLHSRCVWRVGKWSRLHKLRKGRSPLVKRRFNRISGTSSTEECLWLFH